MLMLLMLMKLLPGLPMVLSGFCVVFSLSVCLSGQSGSAAWQCQVQLRIRSYHRHGQWIETHFVVLKKNAQTILKNIIISLNIQIALPHLFGVVPRFHNSLPATSWVELIHFISRKPFQIIPAQLLKSSNQALIHDA